MRKLSSVALVLLLGCKPLPTVSDPAMDTIQTDSGRKLCEYVTVKADNTEALVGVCADDTDKLRAAVAVVKAAFPIAEELAR